MEFGKSSGRIDELSFKADGAECAPVRCHAEFRQQTGNELYPDFRTMR